MSDISQSASFPSFPLPMISPSYLTDSEDFFVASFLSFSGDTKGGLVVENPDMISNIRVGGIGFLFGILATLVAALALSQSPTVFEEDRRSEDWEENLGI
jgi:hypothetical protein